MKQYLNLLTDIKDNGVLKSNRTGIDTISVFGRQLRFDLNKGFPLLTTKKLHTKSIIGELLWFLNGSTSAKELREKYGVTIWDEWQNKDGYLGKIYSNQWVRWEVPNNDIITQVKIKDNIGINDSFIIPDNKVIDNINNKKMGKLSGNIYNSNRSGKYKVLDIVDVQNGNSIYNVQFLDTNYITKSSAPNIKSCTVNDKFKKNVYNEGCIGEINYKPFYYKKAYDIWYNMMSRCYNVDNDIYVFYGKKGVFVDQRWRCFSNFLEDITQVPYFEYWKNYPELYDLDKDYYLSNCYSKETCVFLSKNYNRNLNNGLFAYKGTKYDGYEEIFINQSDFAKKYELSKRRISDCINNKIKNHRKWKFEKIYPKKDHIFRKKIIINQIDDIIYGLKNNPDSRRLMLNSWNVSDLKDMNLPPCHYGFQCYSVEMTEEERILMYKKEYYRFINKEIDNDYLDKVNFPKRKLTLMWNQRSVDTFLGLPFNIASYAFLTHMLASVTNHVVDELVCNLGDTHLYVNHMEYVEKQLLREPRNLPKLKMKKRNSIYDYKFEDFNILNYDPYMNWKNVPIAI